MKILSFLMLCTSSLFAGLSSGDIAPDFTLKNQDGHEVKLSDFKGKTVVLEWVNFGCPFVKKFYDAGEMQRLQTQAKKDGVVWLSIISSAEGKQGHYDTEALKAKLSEENVAAAHYLIDANGKVGKAYDAKVTPHMYVINNLGALVYQGAIDSIRSSKAEDISKATNYVVEALKAIESGVEIKVAQSKPYGCGVKYAK